MQPALLEPPPNAVAVEPDGDQLVSRDDAMLALCEQCDPHVQVILSG
ncbi:MAG: hypothetical protein M3131_08750 [Actinomycetota bacterium]|nr:hypothetical protein [Actinomycetota bacterium]